jgi:CheY-like chemotaxis protein
MASHAKRVLVVASDRFLLQSRALLLRHKGYHVCTVAMDNEALGLLRSSGFDLVLLGRTSPLTEGGSLEQRIRQHYPTQLILKIERTAFEESPYVSRTVDSEPRHVIDAVQEMLEATDCAKTRRSFPQRPG